MRGGLQEEGGRHDKPIGLAEHHLLQGLPDNLAQNLPSIDQIEAGLLGDWTIG